MIVLAGTVRLTVDSRAAALPAMQTMVEASRTEPGCVGYAFAFDVLDERLIRVFEIFQDEDALVAHRASQHMSDWRAAMTRLGIGERDMSEYLVSAYRRI